MPRLDRKGGRRPPATFAHIAMMGAGALCISPGPAPAGDWPAWRGPTGDGVAAAASKPPTRWSETENIRWKLPLPGLGHSTPIVSGDRVFLTAAIPFGERTDPPVWDGAPGSHDNLPVAQRHRFVALCASRSSGEILWQTTCREAFPHEGGHVSGSLASASPATDGKYLIAHFGSYGTYGIDAATGEILWRRQLGKMATKHAHGEGSSPALYRDTVVVNWDHEERSALFALAKATGGDRWKVERDEATSWSTPLVVEHRGTVQVIVSASNRARGYDLADGEVIWECGGMSRNVVASPVSAGGMVYLGCSYDRRAMIAIDLDGAAGDITATDKVVWSTNKRTPYVPSPLLYRGTLYYLSHYQGILSVTHARSGEAKAGPFRIDALRDIYASPVAAAGHVYITSREGWTVVLAHRDEPAPVAVNRLDDRFSASAAIAGDSIFLRGEKYLYHIAEK